MNEKFQTSMPADVVISALRDSQVQWDLHTVLRHSSLMATTAFRAGLVRESGSWSFATHLSCLKYLREIYAASVRRDIRVKSVACLAMHLACFGRTDEFGARFVGRVLSGASILLDEIGGAQALNTWVRSGSLRSASEVLELAFILGRLHDCVSESEAVATIVEFRARWIQKWGKLPEVLIYLGLRVTDA